MLCVFGVPETVASSYSHLCKTVATAPAGPILNSICIGTVACKSQNNVRRHFLSHGIIFS